MPLSEFYLSLALRNLSKNNHRHLVKACKIGTLCFPVLVLMIAIHAQWCIFLMKNLIRRVYLCSIDLFSCKHTFFWMLWSPDRLHSQPAYAQRSACWEWLASSSSTYTTSTCALVTSLARHLESPFLSFSSSYYYSWHPFAFGHQFSFTCWFRERIEYFGLWLNQCAVEVSSK